MSHSVGFLVLVAVVYIRRGTISPASGARLTTLLCLNDTVKYTNFEIEKTSEKYIANKGSNLIEEIEISLLTNEVPTKSREVKASTSTPEDSDGRREKDSNRNVDISLPSR